VLSAFLLPYARQTSAVCFLYAKAGKNRNTSIPWLEIKHNTMPTTKITVNSNGSLKVEGDFEIVDPQGNVYGLQGRTALGLCRCGLSKNKPFCDGSHNGHLDHQAVAFDLPPKKV
jgi:CDGSH-type Zn-finger protein